MSEQQLKQVDAEVERLTEELAKMEEAQTTSEVCSSITKEVDGDSDPLHATMPDSPWVKDRGTGCNCVIS